MRFSYKQMEEYAALVRDSPENTTVNIHHCKSGHNNDRLYITNKGDVVVAYCHHCKYKGSWKVKRAAYKKHVAAIGKKSYHHLSGNLPADLLIATDKWPIKAIKWALDAGLTTADILSNGFGYSPKLNRVVIPIIHNGYKGYTARRLDGDGPKYLNAYKDGKDGFVFTKRVGTSKVLVIVEDILSTIRVAGAGYNAVALLGTSLDQNIINLILAEGYTDFILWLDNDNPDVKLQQARIKQTLELFGKCNLVKTDNDPKSYTNKEIESILGD